MALHRDADDPQSVIGVLRLMILYIIVLLDWMWFVSSDRNMKNVCKTSQFICLQQPAGLRLKEIIQLMNKFFLGNFCVQRNSKIDCWSHRNLCELIMFKRIKLAGMQNEKSDVETANCV